MPHRSSFGRVITTPDPALPLTAGTKAYQQIGNAGSNCAPPWRHRLLMVELHFSGLTAPATAVIQVYRDAAHDYSWLEAQSAINVERGVTTPGIGTVRFDFADKDIYHEGVDGISVDGDHDYEDYGPQAKDVTLELAVTLAGSNANLVRVVYVFDA